MDQPIPDAASVVALRLPPDDWDDVLDALGAAAEHTSADIDCDTCATSTACPRHDGDWARIDRWRALAIRLRDQLTATPH